MAGSKTARWLFPLAGLTLAAALNTRTVDDVVLQNAGKTGEDWLSYGFSPGETRYSPLKQINATNVSHLALAWSYDLGAGGAGQEATPLTSNGVIYGITNWSVVFAVDALTGKERWRADPGVDQAAVRPMLCCGAVNRGVAIYRGLILAPVIDGRLRALDAGTGKLVWETRVASVHDKYTITIAPRIAKGKVIIGVSGGEFATRGFFSAYDAMTGHLAWKFFTVPGDPSKPFESPAMKQAAQTWNGEWWKQGGGGPVWDGISYDPEAGLLYVGVGNAEPWPGQLRNAGNQDNLYTSSILAVQVDTGELKWYFQTVPDDSWDFDSTQQMTLADLTLDGRPRKVLMQANKNGFFYVLDRLTGQFLSAQPFGKVTWAKGIDQKTGHPIVNAEARYGVDAILISPGAAGAHNWSPMSFNPNTNLVYIPTLTDSGTTFAAMQVFAPASGKSEGVIRPPPPIKRRPPPAVGPEPMKGTRGALVAWDPVTQRMVWRTPGGGATGGGTVTTAGNLVFQVIGDGRLLAYSADKGQKLLEIQTGLHSGMGPPVTWQFKGKQYVSLMGGIGGAGAGTDPPKLLTFALNDAPSHDSSR